MKPILIYVDDEPMNLTVFVAALPEDWEIHTFDNPLKAIEAMEKIEPWLVISDQKMPGMNGVAFLEIVKEKIPQALRVIATGFSDDDLVIDSVRKAQISDYIKKPWDVDDLCHRLEKLIETYILQRDVVLKNREIEEKNVKLEQALLQVKKAKDDEQKLRYELESWAPPFLLNSFEKLDSFPMKKDLTLITYDLINSADLHSVFINNRSVKAIIMHKFTDLVIRHGGWREHHSGDLAYAHFGLLKDVYRPCDTALAVAIEFRKFLKDFNLLNGTNINCGIGLHFAKDCLVDIHTIEVKTPEKDFIQKSFDTSSKDVDLVFRIEKFAHRLPGTNLVLTEEFIERLHASVEGLFPVHGISPKGYGRSITLFISRSDLCTDHLIAEFSKNLKVA